MLELSRKIKLEKVLEQGLRVISSAIMSFNLLDSAINYDKLFSLEEELMKAYNNRGNACFYTSEYETALEYYYKADEMAKAKFPKEVAGSVNEIG